MFNELVADSYVIWPIQAGHIPSLTEGKERLLLLRKNGPSPEAYDFATGKDIVVR
ncbi:DUF3291 domain-containing protein [Ruegeria sp. HKCCD6109]|uniref:DUF3291 domain-containing protein n=1 Tax=Ruegeria sp. HKCCD6109 TaxID=2683017 RepID=UPI0014912F83|nr:DUF3291 domain-containing protein [Ruegeria sp. HKCCD6109]